MPDFDGLKALLGLGNSRPDRPSRQPEAMRKASADRYRATHPNARPYHPSAGKRNKPPAYITQREDVSLDDAIPGLPRDRELGKRWAAEREASGVKDAVRARAGIPTAPRTTAEPPRATRSEANREWERRISQGPDYGQQPERPRIEPVDRFTPAPHRCPGYDIPEWMLCSQIAGHAGECTPRRMTEREQIIAKDEFWDWDAPEPRGPCVLDWYGGQGPRTGGIEPWRRPME